MTSKVIKNQKAASKHQKVEEYESSNTSNSSDEEVDGNIGWADSIAKVLNTNKPKTKKTLVLSRAKKIKPGESSIEKGPSFDFEVDGEIEEEKHDTEELDRKSKKKKNIELNIRGKLSDQDDKHERELRKIATRGVVQFFNAIRIHQEQIEQKLLEAGPLDQRRDAVLSSINKRTFLDILNSGKRANQGEVDKSVKDEIKDEDIVSDDEDSKPGTSKRKNAEWSVLRDDFMTNKKIKHWDQEDSENSEKESKLESDDDG